MNSRVRRFGVAAVAAALLLTASACGNDNTDDAGGDTEAEADTSVSGDIAISGSSTVEPISTAAAEAFRAQNDSVDISVEGPGTGDGFEMFCGGETDISDASRPIKEEEAAACADAGIEFIELEVGIDGLSVITAADNPLECLSFADLYALVGPEAEGFESWTDATEVAGRRLGSSTEFPDENLVVTAPGEESGTYDSFIEIVLGDVSEARFEEGDITEDAGRDRPQRLLVQRQRQHHHRGRLGRAGWPRLGRLRLRRPGRGREADAGVGRARRRVRRPRPRRPSRTAATRSARSLYIYVNAAKAEENEALAAFVDFYVEGLTGFVEGADYIALADDAGTVSDLGGPHHRHHRRRVIPG